MLRLDIRMPTVLTYNNPVTERLIKFAIDTGAVAAEVTNIPHQPITFAVSTAF